MRKEEEAEERHEGGNREKKGLDGMAGGGNKVFESRCVVYAACNGDLLLLVHMLYRYLLFATQVM